MSTNNQENFSAIEVITVVPKSRRFCQYILNDGEMHTKKYQELKNFIISIVPSLAYEINDCIRTFRSFMILVTDKKLIRLSVDPEKELEKIKEDLKRFNLKDINQTIKESRKQARLKSVDKFKDSDYNINQISNIGRNNTN